MRLRKINIDSMSGKRIDGIITNQPVELTDQQMEAIAEGIMQVLYNMGVYSGVEFNYDLKIDDGTKYLINGTDVTVLPKFQDSYNRRIRNSAETINKKDKKDDAFLREMEKMDKN